MKPGPRKRKTRFSLTDTDGSLRTLVRETDRTTLALWAVDCAGRVLHFFEEEFPEDPRPRVALTVCREWITSGEFSMAAIRTASLAAHAAAREVGRDNAARSAARAAGQAVAAAHVPSHAIVAAQYALQAVWRAAGPEAAEAAVAKEREWQERQLLILEERSDPEG